MRRILYGLLFLLAWGGSLGPGDISAKPLPTPQKSGSRQFVVYGERKDLVAYVMWRADSLVDRWNSLLRFGSLGPQLPIIIRLVEHTSSKGLIRTPFETKLLLTDDNHLKVQLDVLDLNEIRDFEFDWRVLQTLALRSAYAATPPGVGRKYCPPPDWIVDAVLQDILDTAEGDFARAYAAALVTAQNLDLKVFLAERPEMMDAVSRVIYRVKARALLQSLIELPGGREGLRSFLSSPSAWDGLAASLIACFPALQGNVNNLTKVWVLNLARPTVAQRIFPLTLNETIQRLDAILLISLPEDVKPPKNKLITGVEAFPLVATVPKYHYLLRGKAQDLLLLSLRAHPMYRPLIDEYREIVETLLRNPRKNLDGRIKAAKKLQDTLNQRHAAIEDYLNWFESAVWTDASQPFQSILENDQRRRVPTWRSDAISRALDTAEAAGW